MKATHLAALAVACTLGAASTAMAQSTATQTKPATKQATTQQQPAAQQDTGVKTDIPPALAKQAKITLDSARAIAMTKVPNGTIASQELEREHGRLIYSFDVKTAGKAGVEEVNVSALNGKVISVHHETPAAEKREAAKESTTTRKP